MVEDIVGRSSYIPSNEVVIERAESLFLIFNDLHKSYKWNNSLYLNYEKLRLCVSSYYQDLYRFKVFHGSELADIHKKAAYTIKWISVIKPIQINNPAYQMKSNEILANELFAVFSGLSLMDTVKTSSVSASFLSHLIYTCNYRYIEPLQMATSMYLLEKSILKQLP
jgi:hypothetical protein